MKILIRLMIKFYRKFINPVLHAVGGPLAGCRFRPTCSQYFLDAVEIHGVCKGVCLGIWRILRCNPWGGTGHDPVPPRKGDGKAGETSCSCCVHTSGESQEQGKQTDKGE